jgi:anaerobic selenocysteine-containing dehydrogenase
MARSSVVHRRFDRRTFLQGSAATSVALLAGSPLARAQASDRLNIAIIGCGGRGGSNMRDVLTQNIVACDVNENNILKASRRLPKPGCPRFPPDVRRSEGQRVRRGGRKHNRTHNAFARRFRVAAKHVHCEKPLTHNASGAHCHSGAQAAVSLRKWARMRATTIAVSWN